MTITFINRTLELEYLNKEYIDNKFKFISIIGRRRVGKTALVEEFLRNKQNSAYFMVPEINDKDLRLSFANHLYQTVNLSFIGSPSWDDIFSKVFEKAKKERVILIIDEFQRFQKINHSVPSILQNHIDSNHKTSKLYLVVLGSSIGMMNSIFEYAAPLYGRRTGQINVDALKFNHLLKWFKDESFEKLINIYAVFGGTPRYLMQYDTKKSFHENIKKELISKNSPLYNEPELLIRTELSEPSTYFNILKAIASGNTRPNDISNISGIKPTSLSYFLTILEKDMDLITKSYPTSDNKRKKTLYYIKDNFFNFWFKFIFPYQSYLEIEQTNRIDEELRTNLDKHTSLCFERICQDYLIIKHPSFQTFGKEWGKFKGEKGKNTYEIDVCGINEKTKEILFAECKWQDDVDAQKLLLQLKEKSKYVDWNKDSRKECFAIFAKSFKTKNVEEVKLYDLKDMEELFMKK